MQTRKQNKLIEQALNEQNKTESANKEQRLVDLFQQKKEAKQLDKLTLSLKPLK